MTIRLIKIFLLSGCLTTSYAAESAFPDEIDLQQTVINKLLDTHRIEGLCLRCFSSSDESKYHAKAASSYIHLVDFLNKIDRQNAGYLTASQKRFLGIYKDYIQAHLLACIEIFESYADNLVIEGHMADRMLYAYALRNLYILIPFKPQRRDLLNKLYDITAIMIRAYPNWLGDAPVLPTLIHPEKGENIMTFLGFFPESLSRVLYQQNPNLLLRFIDEERLRISAD